MSRKSKAETKPNIIWNKDRQCYDCFSFSIQNAVEHWSRYVTARIFLGSGTSPKAAYEQWQLKKDCHD